MQFVIPVPIISIVLQEKDVRRHSCELLIMFMMFIVEETALRGGAGIKFITIIIYAITRKLFKLFQVILSMFVEI